VETDGRGSDSNKSPNKPENADEIIGQVDMNRDLHNFSVLGNSFYRAINKDDLLLGPENLKKRLADGFYATAALPPSMPWLDQTKPAPPVNLHLQKKEHGIWVLTWNDANAKVNRYGIYLQYRENTEAEQQENPGGLIAVTGEKQWKIPKEINLQQGDLLSVTAISGNNVESSPGQWLRVSEMKK